jgi:hypothetical protein
MRFANTELGSYVIREREADPEDFESRLKALASATVGQWGKPLSNNSTQSVT